MRRQWNGDEEGTEWADCGEECGKLDCVVCVCVCACVCVCGVCVCIGSALCV